MIHYQRLKAILTRSTPLAVAFSGGVDSTLLLKVAHDTLGDRCCAITIDAPYHFRQEQDDATRFARQIGVRHLIIPFAPASVPDLLNNPPERCYLCKQALLKDCFVALPPHWNLADGSTCDDQKAHRPGSRALAELGVRSPLTEAGFSKQDVRLLSRQLELPDWDRPAQSCLLTRFPHHTDITPRALQQVEQAETAIKGLGFRVVRVRSLGTMARLEFEKGELAQAKLPGVCDQLEAICRNAGFTEVSLDPAGYRSGSMDQN
ncbi:ATP-dependent sacrificial sulfur transferase LarE [Trichlorobacter lovleyi]|uniref:ExsB family protein n=1 Tax=Trichlorobacter lovleyi (strain ATCC BAA-1151 / DSM 17278 / SZ) TaxID=398767 RepID=B3E8G9_TRIL1|nr:ATP-dependent sacrificial sulfur transferase LarE [Trichlorobacter lovleyi]ACD96645.1 ExsB family protein [Trichlorobacter lovleyi SZ]